MKLNGCVTTVGAANKEVSRHALDAVLEIVAQKLVRDARRLAESVLSPQQRRTLLLETVEVLRTPPEACHERITGTGGATLALILTGRMT